VFDTEVAPQLPKLFQGINTTVFCYGNTGAGTNPFASSNQYVATPDEALFISRQNTYYAGNSEGSRFVLP
jgi:hypothetical protein